MIKHLPTHGFGRADRTKRMKSERDGTACAGDGLACLSVPVGSSPGRAGPAGADAGLNKDRSGCLGETLAD